MIIDKTVPISREDYDAMAAQRDEMRIVCRATQAALDAANAKLSDLRRTVAMLSEAFADLENADLSEVQPNPAAHRRYPA